MKSQPKYKHALMMTLEICPNYSTETASHKGVTIRTTFIRSRRDKSPFTSYYFAQPYIGS